MTGTSKALKRLGVAGLSTVLMSTGLAAFTAVAANAAAATSVSLSPDSDTAATDTCNAFTATVSPNGSTVTVNITQALPSGTAAGAMQIGFCNPTTDTEGNPTAATKPTGNIGGNTTTGGSSCTNTNAFAASPPAGTPNQVSCTTTYTDSHPAGPPTGDGKIIFGVMSNTPGSMSVTGFGESNANGVQDVGEPGDTSTKTWVANTATNSNKISCTPTSATNDTGDTHTFKCTVTDANGVALPNQDVGYVVTSGPDAGAKYEPTTGVATPNPGDTCSTTADGTAGSNVGEASCDLTNNGTPGKDTINAYEDTNGTIGDQNGEPTATITKDFVTPPPPAPATSTVTVTCSPHPTDTASDICQDDPTSDNTATFTATVTNGVPAAPIAGVRVEWTFGDFGNTDTGDTESLSVDQCITNASGTCSTILTDTKPLDGESFDVNGEIDRGVGGLTSDDAVKNFIQPGFGEARNVTVQPATATQTSGGAQEFVATVTDRFGNPVEDADVNWSETGPGAFRSGDFCSTDSHGQCTIEVDSLDNEQGNETVTANIEDNIPVCCFNNDSAECHSPAGYSAYDEDGNEDFGNGSVPNSGGQNDVAPGATAGNCTASGVVTWSSTPPPPPGKVHMHLHLACFSHDPGKIKCVAQASPAIKGLTVKFFNKKGKKVAEDLTNKAGKASFVKKGKKHGKTYTFQAHLKSSSKTYSADSKNADVTVQ